MNRNPVEWSQWPFVVRLRDSENRPWTGSIVASHYILTAAHCIVDDHRRVAHQKDIFLLAFGEARERTGYDIDWIAAHPDYRFSKDDGMRYGFMNDVALIKVRNPLPNIQVRCLPMDEEIQHGDGEVVTQLGFGKNPDSSNQLWRCDGEFLRYANPSTDFYNEGTLATRTDTRGGDSGGPVVIRERTEGDLSRWAQVGVHSLGGTQSGSICDMGACTRTAREEVFDWIGRFVGQPSERTGH